MEEKFPPAILPADPPQCEAHSSQGEAIPTKEGAELPQGNAYPPQDGTYIYPPQGETYPLQGGAYPPQDGANPPQGGANTQQGGAYPPQGGADPPQSGAYPPQGGAYPEYPPQQGGAYPSQQDGVYPPQQGGVQPGFNGSPPLYYPQATPQQQTNVVIVQPKSTAPVRTKVGDYGYTLSIVLTVICFLCGSWCSLCLTIPAIFVASSARDAAARGDLLGAKRKGRIANSLNAGAVIAFVLLWVMIVIRL